MQQTTNKNVFTAEIKQLVLILVAERLSGLCDFKVMNR